MGAQNKIRVDLIRTLQCGVRMDKISSGRRWELGREVDGHLIIQPKSQGSVSPIKLRAWNEKLFYVSSESVVTHASLQEGRESIAVRAFPMQVRDCSLIV
jgi:hypothetical protein